MEERTQEQDACTLEPLDTLRFPWLFWGDRKVARNEQLLRRRKITYIINCTPPCGEGGVPNFHERAAWGSRNTFRYLRIPVYDTQAETLQPHFEEVWEVMETCRTREDGNVLIHCNHGVSRSVAFVCSYLIRFEGMSCDEALAFVRRRNPLAKPNDGFRDQLKQLHERVLRESRSGGSEPRHLHRGGASWVPPFSNVRKRVVTCSLPCPRPRSKVKRQMGPVWPPQLTVVATPQSNEDAADSVDSVEAEDASSGRPSRPLSLSAPSSPSEAVANDREPSCANGEGRRLVLPVAAEEAASEQDLTSSSPLRDDADFADDAATTVGNASPLETPRALASPTANTQDFDWLRTVDGGKEASGCRDVLGLVERAEGACQAPAFVRISKARGIRCMRQQRRFAGGASCTCLSMPLE
ncbi:hypothetical protein Efla_001458 [Eimeria flavescens]